MKQIPARQHKQAAWFTETDLPATQGMSHWQEMLVADTAHLTGKAKAWLAEQIFTPDTSRAGRISPSSINTCERRQMLAYSGEKPKFSERSVVFMNMGKWSHWRWQSAGLSEGFLVAAETRVSCDDARISGSMDGILADGSGFELKTTSDRNFTWVRVKGPGPDYTAQVYTYMLL